MLNNNAYLGPFVDVRQPPIGAACNPLRRNSPYDRGSKPEIQDGRLDVHSQVPFSNVGTSQGKLTVDLHLKGLHAEC